MPSVKVEKLNANLSKKARVFGEKARSAAKKMGEKVREFDRKAFGKNRRPSRSELINAESALGSTIFGPVPEGHRREFFHDKEGVWLWHEAWTENETEKSLTVRYEVRTTGVYKKVAAGKYYRLEGEELENFRRATHEYLRVIKEGLYKV